MRHLAILTLAVLCTMCAKAETYRHTLKSGKVCKSHIMWASKAHKHGYMICRNAKGDIDHVIELTVTPKGYTWEYVTVR